MYGKLHYTDHIGPYLSIYASDGGPSVHITEPFYKDGAGRAVALAQLFVASPDLLAACEELMEWAGQIKDIRAAGGPVEACELARAAIAKARSKTE